MKRYISQYRGLNRSIYALFFAMLVTNMGSFIWPLLTLILSDKLGYEKSYIGMLTFIIGAFMLPVAFIGGKLADHFNKKTIIIVLDILTFLSYITCSFLEPSSTMIVMFVLAGIFAIMELPVFSALIMEISSLKERDKAYSLLYLGRNLGLVFAGIIGGFLFANYLHIAFLLDGITTISSTILIIFFVTAKGEKDYKIESNSEYEEDIDINSSALEILFSKPTIVIHLLVCTLSGIVYSQWSFIIPLYMGSLFGASTGGASFFGVLTSINGLVVIVSTPILTFILRKHRSFYKIILGIFMYSSSYLLLMFNNRAIFVLMMVMFTIGEVTHSIGSRPYLSHRTPATHRGRLSSYESGAYSVGYALSNLIVGYLLSFLTYNKVFIIIFISGIFVCLITYANYHYDRRTFPKLYSNSRRKVWK